MPRPQRHRSQGTLPSAVALRECALLKGDAIETTLSRGVYLAHNPALPTPTLLRADCASVIKREAALLRHLNASRWSAAPAYYGRWKLQAVSCLRAEYVVGRTLLDIFSSRSASTLSSISSASIAASSSSTSSTFTTSQDAFNRHHDHDDNDNDNDDDDQASVGPHRLPELAGKLARLLRSLHARHVVHSDVKPGHVVVTADGSLRLIDWEHGRSALAVESVGCCRTPQFAAPEARQALALAHPSLDVWSFGATLFFLSTAGAPTSDMDRLLPLPHLPAWFSCMLRAACTVDPLLRPSMSQICDRFFSIRAATWPDVLQRQIVRGVGKQIADSFHGPVSVQRASASPRLPPPGEQRARMRAARSPALDSESLAAVRPHHNLSPSQD